MSIQAETAQRTVAAVVIVWGSSDSVGIKSLSRSRIVRITGMQRQWRNLYKRADIFFCPHRLHKHHEQGTSAWHILKNKNCYPHGCNTFRWRCQKFEANQKCPRGKKHVGKDCFSCPFFYDLKESYQPDLSIEPVEYEKFQREFAEFEDWIYDLKGKRLEVRGEIASISPLLVNFGENGNLRIAGQGVLLYFRSGILGYDKFLDPLYARLSFEGYLRSGVAVGDEVDFKGELQIDRGRFVFRKVGSIEKIHASGRSPIPVAQLRAAKFTGTMIDGQPSKCMRCPNGLLIDSANGDGRSQPRRLMYCTKGVADYRYCTYNV